MSKFGKISGFPEWLPEQKLVEDQVIATVRSVYQSYGFVPLETAAVEHLSVLGAKGVIDKEIYSLKRAKDEEEGDAELGLHFDLSVPMARYVAQNVGKLSFPFKRYQCQKVWRGDRPQKGRFREFYQFDIDIIAQEELPLSCDAEILNAYAQALAAINIGRFLIKCSNRKVMLGFFESFGLDAAQQEGARIAVDKILKIGPDGVLRELNQTVGTSVEVAQKIVAFAGMSFGADQAQEKLAALQIENATFAQGAKELGDLLELLDAEVRARLIVDLSLARGLDYYTGLVFEVYLPEHPEFGSVGGGGRYDNLTSQFINKKLPGVGASIGLTRLMDLIFDKGLLSTAQKTLTKVLVAVYDEPQRRTCNEVAAKLRACGVPTEVFYKSPKLGKQIDSAAAKGIPYVLFVQPGGVIEVKDLNSKEQKTVTDLMAFAKEVLGAA
jgi:histidyl-tRNA synthetase